MYHLRQVVVRKVDGSQRRKRSKGEGKWAESVASKEESLKPEIHNWKKCKKYQKPFMAKKRWERGETVVPQVKVSEDGKLVKKIHRKLLNLVVLRDWQLHSWWFFNWDLMRQEWFRGIVHHWFYHLNLMFWIVMGWLWLERSLDSPNSKN